MFLKNRTYVDDATGGADTLGAARQVSLDIEDILENRGFRFKESCFIVLFVSGE
jgi:hypothetical protein